MHRLMYDVLATLEPVVDVDIGDKGGGAWYANPLWVGVGVVVLLLVVLISVTAAKKS